MKKVRSLDDPPALQMITERIERALPRFEAGRKYYRRGSLIQTLLMATLGALTTFLIGMDGIYHQTWITALSLASAAMTTVVGAWNAWFGFKPLWINNQSTVNCLYELRDRIRLDQALNPGTVPTDDELRGYFERYQQIIDRANSEWTKIRLSKD